MDRPNIRFMVLVICIISLLLIAALSLKYVTLLIAAFTQKNAPTTAQIQNGSLCVLMSAEPSDITTNQTSYITIEVTCAGSAVNGALVNLTCNGGSLNGTCGITDSNGKLAFLFFSKTPGKFTINSSAFMIGYKPGSNRTEVTVSDLNPKLEELENLTSIPFKPSDLKNVTRSGCSSCYKKDGELSLIDDGISSAEGGKGGETPLFRIYGLPRSPYLRTSAGEVYQSGIWSPSPSKGEKYVGGIIYIPPLNSEIWSLEVVPLFEIGGFLPVMRETCEIKIEYELTRFPSMFSFHLNGTTAKPYEVIYTPEVHDEELLRDAKCPKDTTMLQLPSSITNRTRELAVEVTKGIVGDYQKALVIRDYLRKNYAYEENYTRAPEGWDPVDWFLFEEKKGVCANFNSAFAILCRCVGIPARVVRGYLIRTDTTNQTVREKQAHCWAEVEFDGFEWVSFDATGVGVGGDCECGPQVNEPLPQRVKTVTEITFQPSTAVRGDAIFVSGTVKTIYGFNVSGLRTFIYIMKDKFSSAFILGAANVTNCVFNVTCMIPMNYTIGRFLIVAKTSDNEYYIGSTSDPPITVMCRTKLSVSCTDLVSIGENFEIHGKLMESETTLPISNAILNINIEGVSVSSTTTDLAGLYSILTSIYTPGNYKIHVNYLGDDLRLPCETEKVIRVVSINLNWTAETRVIREEPWGIRGKVTKGEKGIEGTEVILELDDIKIATSRTDSSGGFEMSYKMPEDMPLGAHSACVALSDYGLTDRKTIFIFAKTRIIVELPKEVEEGKIFLLNVSLLDNLNQAIAGEELNINVSSKAGTTLLKRRTNEDGFLSLNLTAPTDQRVDVISVEVNFPGSGYYIGSWTNSSAKVQHVTLLKAPLSTGIIATLSISLICAFIIIRKKSEKTKKLEPESNKTQKPEEEPVEKTEVNLKFPSIGEPFPLVWGVGDPLAVNLVCKGPIQEDFILELVVDESRFFSKECQSEQSLTLNFSQKGDHTILARISHQNDVISETKTLVRIVDYREEISSMHGAIVDEAKKIGISLEQALTLREELVQIIRATDKVDKETLGEFYSILEKVDYSLKPISRGDYEKAYLLLLSIRTKLTSSEVSG